MASRFSIIFLAAFLAAGFCASSVFAQTSATTTPTPPASTVPQLQEMIETLLEQVLQLQQQLVELGGTSTITPDSGIGATTPSSSPSSAIPSSVSASDVELPESSLPAFVRSLSLGSFGDDVRDLQQFLAKDKDIYPEGLTTGYFGSLTERAVQRWQTREGIVSQGSSDTTGYGRIGPKTRARLNELLTQGVGRSGVIPLDLLRAPGLQDKVSTTTPLATTTPSFDGAGAISTTTPTTIATTTPSIATATPATPAVPATPAQPTQPQTVTQTPTVSATPAVPATTSTTTAPAISNVQATGSTAVSIEITWTTSEPADGVVEYGLTASYGSSAASSTLETSHTIYLFDLQSYAEYHYRVKSKDAAGNTAASVDYTFTTLAASLSLLPVEEDKTRPSLFNLKASSYSSWGKITWNTNEPADGKVEYGPTISYGSVAASSTLETYHAIYLPLSFNTTYYYRIISKDAAGNIASSGHYTFPSASSPLPPSSFPAIQTGTGKAFDSTDIILPSGRIFYSSTASSSGYVYPNMWQSGSSYPIAFANLTQMISPRIECGFPSAALGGYDYKGVSNICEFTSAINYTFTSLSLGAVRFANKNHKCSDGIILFRQNNLYGGIEFTDVKDSALTYRYWVDTSGGSNFSSICQTSNTLSKNDGLASVLYSMRALLNNIQQQIQKLGR